MTIAKVHSYLELTQRFRHGRLDRDLRPFLLGRSENAGPSECGNCPALAIVAAAQAVTNRIALDVDDALLTGTT